MRRSEREGGEGKGEEGVRGEGKEMRNVLVYLYLCVCLCS